jgi:hypothetical protein
MKIIVTYDDDASEFIDVERLHRILVGNFDKNRPDIVKIIITH